MPNDIGQVVSVADALRLHLLFTHRQFAKHLGRDESEWHHLLAGRRDPSDAFLRALRAAAAEAGGRWPLRVDMAIQEDALARVSA